MSDENGHLNLTQVADLLGMRRANVSRFLEGHGVEPVITTPWRRRWARRDVQAAWADYERSGRREADERRRESARKRHAV